jgi:hypothetical protein
VVATTHTEDHHTPNNDDDDTYQALVQHNQENGTLQGPTQYINSSKVTTTKLFKLMQFPHKSGMRFANPFTATHAIKQDPTYFACRYVLTDIADSLLSDNNLQCLWNLVEDHVRSGLNRLRSAKSQALKEAFVCTCYTNSCITQTLFLSLTHPFIIPF